VAGDEEDDPADVERWVVGHWTNVARYLHDESVVGGIAERDESLWAH